MCKEVVAVNVKSLLAVTTVGVLSVAVCGETYGAAVAKHYHVELAGPVRTVDAVRYTVSGYRVERRKRRW